MPGNELGDGVHNFFAQDNLSQEQHHSQIVEGNRPVLNNNFWVDSQRKFDLSHSDSKNYGSHISGNWLFERQVQIFCYISVD